MRRLLLLLLGVWSAAAAAQEAMPPDLTGTFHLRMHIATDAKVPVIGTTRVNTASDMVATVRMQDGQFIQSHYTCFVKSVPTRGIARTVLPEAFIKALPVKTYPLVLTQDAQGWRFDADLMAQSVGYHPEKSDGVMPKKADHPAIYDWDGDGKPGASVLLHVPLFGAFRIYMVQWSHGRLTGRVQSKDQVSGKMIMMNIDQKTIGADNVLFTANASISPAPDPQPFMMTRIAEGSTCADLKRP